MLFKTLLKKQLSELYSFFFMSRKTGQRRTKSSAIGMVGMYIGLFVMLGASFFAMFSEVVGPLAMLDLTWMYFALVVLFSLLLGIFGSVFNTYASIYKAKDNDLLLAMPIEPSDILKVRIFGVFTMSMMYHSLIYIPGFIAYATSGYSTAMGIICSVLLWLVLGLLVTALTCALGWVVALFSSRVKNKNAVIMILSVGGFGFYFYFCMNMYEYLEELVVHALMVGEIVKNKGYPLYVLGNAASGNLIHLLVVAAISIALLFLTYVLMSRSFLNLAVLGNTTAKREFKKKSLKNDSMSLALFKKEWRRFTSSPTYMMNGGIGTVMMLFGSVAAIFYKDTLLQQVDMMTKQVGFSHDLILTMLALSAAIATSMTLITAPSISLEGKNIWILQSLPVATKEIFDAKQALHIAVGLTGAIPFSLSISYILSLSVLETVLLLTTVVLASFFTSALGLVTNLLWPNLNWTNETVPVKQGLPVFIGMFGPMVLFGGGILLALRLGQKLQAMTFISIVCIVIALLDVALNYWIRTKGTKIFESL